jgi:hypothetical protein
MDAADTFGSGSREWDVPTRRWHLRVELDAPMGDPVYRIDMADAILPL